MTPFVPHNRPLSDATDRPPVVVVEVTESVPVAVTLPAKYELPTTDSLANGELVPSPRFPNELRVMILSPVDEEMVIIFGSQFVAYISRLEFGTVAVVVPIAIGLSKV